MLNWEHQGKTRFKVDMDMTSPALREASLPVGQPSVRLHERSYCHMNIVLCKIGKTGCMKSQKQRAKSSAFRAVAVPLSQNRPEGYRQVHIGRLEDEVISHGGVPPQDLQGL